MKKGIYLLLITILFFSNIPLVKAKDITFQDVASKMKEPFSMNLDGGEILLTAIEPYTTVTSTNNTIVAKYVKDDVTREVKFNYDNNIISYAYEGSKNDSSVATYGMIDGLVISKLVYVVAELKGYTKDDLINLEIDEKELSLKENGIEITTFKYSETNSNEYGSGSINMEVYDTLKLDLNKFNLIKDVKSEVNNPNNIENPKTSMNTKAINSAIILVLGFIIINIIRKKDYIRRI